MRTQPGKLSDHLTFPLADLSVPLIGRPPPGLLSSFPHRFLPPCGSYSVLVAVSQGFLESWMSCRFSHECTAQTSARGKKNVLAGQHTGDAVMMRRTMQAAFELSGGIGCGSDWYRMRSIICFTGLWLYEKIQCVIDRSCLGSWVELQDVTRRLSQLKFIAISK